MAFQIAGEAPLAEGELVLAQPGRGVGGEAGAFGIAVEAFQVDPFAVEDSHGAEAGFGGAEGAFVAGVDESGAAEGEGFAGGEDAAELAFFIDVEMAFADQAAFDLAMSSEENKATGKDVMAFAKDIVSLMVAKC